MALLYRAEVVPSKLELINGWLPGRDWYRGPAGPDVTRVSGARLDDPDGEVGVEIILVRSDDGPIYQTPLTYRSAPLSGAEEWLIGTAEHSVLGTRWVYDACGDPVYARVLADVIISGGNEAEEYVQDSDGGNRVRRDPAMTLRGSGHSDAVAPTMIVEADDHGRILTDTLTLQVVRVLDESLTTDGGNLVGTWPQDGRPYLLAHTVALPPAL